ncbi:MAG: DUF5611 family protein [Methanomassiliicoccales archaeon]|nr:DUF5611 family protein [Methanomassiliicoccales archaeon]
MEYDIRKGHYAEIEGDGLKRIMTDLFMKASQEGNSVISSYGALARIEAKILSKSSLSVNTESDPSVPNDVASDTIRRFNLFLERATGFTSKQRRDRLQKKAKEGKL